MDLEIGDIDEITGDIFMLSLPSKESLMTDKYQFNTLINIDKSKIKKNDTIPYVIINPVMEELASNRLSINSDTRNETSLFKYINIGIKN